MALDVTRRHESAGRRCVNGASSDPSSAPINSDKEEVPGSCPGSPPNVSGTAEQFGSRLEVVASVDGDGDGSELLASQRWQRAARARQTAVVLAETAAELRITAAELLETAAELRAQALELRAQRAKEREAAGEWRRIQRR